MHVQKKAFTNVLLLVLTVVVMMTMMLVGDFKQIDFLARVNPYDRR
jgi:hypothetical protein